MFLHSVNFSSVSMDKQPGLGKSQKRCQSNFRQFIGQSSVQARGPFCALISFPRLSADLYSSL